jgi:hypothetical protein
MAIANRKRSDATGFNEYCPVAPSIYLLIDRGSRLAGIAILAGRVDNFAPRA